MINIEQSIKTLCNNAVNSKQSLYLISLIFFYHNGYFYLFKRGLQSFSLIFVYTNLKVVNHAKVKSQ